MPYCSRCGVEVAKEAITCPLCRSAIQKFPDDPSPGRIFPEDELAAAKPKLPLKERLRIAAVTTTFAMLIPILITVTVDSIVSPGLSWSLYPLLTIGAALLTVLASLYSYKKGGRLIWLIFLIFSVMIILMQGLDLISANSTAIGIPLVFALAACSHVALKVSARTKRKGANIGAFVLIAIGAYCVLIELWLTWILRGSVSLNWSLIVLAATQPVSLILLYLHYRKKKNRSQSRLRKYFHI